MCTLKEYKFHFIEIFANGHVDHFLDATAFDKEKAIEIALMGKKVKSRFKLEKDLSNYSDMDYIDYVILVDKEGHGLFDEEYRKLRRNLSIKELLENDN